MKKRQESNLVATFWSKEAEACSLFVFVVCLFSEMDKGRKGEKKKSAHRTLVARAPRVWWLYRLDTEFLQ